jgi:hypothetical protein
MHVGEEHILILILPMRRVKNVIQIITNAEGTAIALDGRGQAAWIFSART